MSGHFIYNRDADLGEKRVLPVLSTEKTVKHITIESGKRARPCSCQSK